jgi:hypothetical protein
MPRGRSPSGESKHGATLHAHRLLTLSTLVPGIFFPIGLLILSAGFMRGRVLPLGSFLTLVLGAVLFPIGHAAGIVPALIVGDLVLLAAFYLCSRPGYALRTA